MLSCLEGPSCLFTMPVAGKRPPLSIALLFTVLSVNRHFFTYLPARDYKNIFEDFTSGLCGSQMHHFRGERLPVLGDPEAQGQLFWIFIPACG